MESAGSAVKAIILGPVSAMMRPFGSYGDALKPALTRTVFGMKFRIVLYIKIKHNII